MLDEVKALWNDEGSPMVLIISNDVEHADQARPKLNLSLAGIEKIVRQLKAEGVLSREGSTKGGKWVVNSSSHNREMMQ